MTGAPPRRRVTVVTGAGGMGTAVARRIASGSTLVLADVDPLGLGAAAESLRAEGFEVVEQVTDVGDPDSVDTLVAVAAAAGPVHAVVHTAGLSPVQAPVDAILRVDLLGTALVLDAFGTAVAPGGAGVFVASMAGTLTVPDPDLERKLAVTPTLALLELPELAPGAVADPGTAYGIAKRANHLRVRAAAAAWGRRGARVNTISPGIIATSMGAAELDGPHGGFMREMLAASPVGRIGTPADIAAVAAFLTGPDAAYVTGTDVLVDGGVVAALRTPAG